MTILLLTLACFAAGIAGYFLLLMSDGRRLRERMLERRPRLVPGEAEPETPLVTPDYAQWLAPPFAAPQTPHAGGPRSLYSTTPESPGLG
jgi:hypothetical protein